MQDDGVLSVREKGNELHMPAAVAPNSDDPLAHLEFALKYQGVELEVIQAVCAKLEPVAASAFSRLIESHVVAIVAREVPLRTAALDVEVASEEGLAATRRHGPRLWPLPEKSAGPNL